MKSGVWILDHDTGFKNMKKDLIDRFGKETAIRIWENAGRNWEALSSQYTHLPEKVKQHTDGQMFRIAVVYMALKEECPSQAMEIMETGVAREGRRVAALLSPLLRIPGMPRVMLWVFGKMLDASFGEDAGFRSTKHCITTDEVYFDILQCPYCKYLTEIGCEEIIHLSCDVDEWIYGNLPGLEFTRSGTLGKGSDRCDFCLKRKR